jgi:hypothetical protein
VYCASSLQHSAAALLQRSLTMHCSCRGGIASPDRALGTCTLMLEQGATAVMVVAVFVFMLMLLTTGAVQSMYGNVTYCRNASAPMPTAGAGSIE